MESKKYRFKDLLQEKRPPVSCFLLPNDSLSFHLTKSRKCGLNGNKSPACSPNISTFYRGSKTEPSMLYSKDVHYPTIVYRPIRPSDLEVLEQIHAALFPIRYESEFFLNIVNGRDIISWAAVDSSRPDNQSDELVGFVTAHIVAAKDSEIQDLLRFDSRNDQTLVYVLTLGVIGSYRNHGIATTLIQEVIKYASSHHTCRAVYLHVIAHNEPAIHFYKKMSFKCLQKLRGFYYIKDQYHDSFLFVYYVNGGRSPCSPLDLIVAIAAYVRSLFTSMVSRMWKSEQEKSPRWSKRKETSSLLVTKNRKTRCADNAGCI